MGCDDGTASLVRIRDFRSPFFERESTDEPVGCQTRESSVTSGGFFGRCILGAPSRPFPGPGFHRARGSKTRGVLASRASEGQGGLSAQRAEPDGRGCIANELLLKLGIHISPRTVRKYMSKRPPHQPRGDQRWTTFIHNHAKAIVACDFLTVVTATFKVFHTFIVIELGTRKLLHINVTDHPRADWTLQQLREAIPSDHTYQYLLHDRDNIYSTDLDT